jgi:aspartate/methionine/tyrosine aminotransferase
LVFEEGYGANLTTYNTFTNGGFDVGALANALAAGAVGKKIVLLNFPNNPTGYTCTEQEAVDIAQVLTQSAAAGNQLVVMLDDAYFGLVYEKGIFTESLFGALADAHENLLAIKLDGPTKEDYVWGFRVGFLTFACKGASEEQLKALEQKAGGVVRGNISNAPSISQAMLLKGYQDANYEAQKKQKYDILQKRYAKIKHILQSHPEYADSFVAMPFNSGYFMCVKPAVDAEQLRKLLISEYNTGVIVLSGLIRLAFSAVPYEKLDALFANLHAAVSKLK